MPHHSRDRRRGYERDEERDRRRRRRADDEYEQVDIGDEEASDGYDGRRHRHHRRSRMKHKYDPHDDDESESDEDDDEESERDVPPPVPSRPAFAKPPPPQSALAGYESDRYEKPRKDKDRSRDRPRNQNKAKESPATSPIKKRDRDRDREGRRRRDSTTADESSPTKARGLRDRKIRDNDKDRYRERSKDLMGGGRSEDEERALERARRRAKQREKDKKHASADSSNSGTQLLNADALAKHNAGNEKKAKVKAANERWDKGGGGLFSGKSRGRDSSAERGKKSKKKRLVSGAILEEGKGRKLRVRGGGHGGKNEKWRKGGGGDDDDDDYYGRGGNHWSRKKKLLIAVGVFIVLLAIIIPVAVVVSKKKGGGGGGEDDDSPTSAPSNKELESIDPDSIPAEAKKTYFDPFSWYDTADFNVTYTKEVVGGLPVMGLNSSWDDTARANEYVPPLDEEFPYGEQPIRGVNVGGWLSLEPFITPSFFDQFNGDVKDEYELTKRLGGNAKDRMEEHYATFINEQSFKEIRDAGFDHVRIPYGYWLVTTYEGDPYLERVGWRYLLRAIEYCRKYGLRVSLDMHGVPGSQNGWNHSGREGKANWLNGTDGDMWGKRSLDVHGQLSKFFAQPRYKNVVTMYGLANEPMMLKMEIEPVIKWVLEAAELIEGNGLKAYIVFGDGFLKLSKWTTMLQDTGHNLVLDTHQYTIFNSDLVGKTHQEKLELVCEDWVELLTDSNSGGDSGWGPTICGEWSQADTDCARYLNNVGVGSRWTGSMNDPDGKSDLVLTPHCPTEMGETDSKEPCSCDEANADPSEYSDSYKTFLQGYAEAQIHAFEQAWGWFYWTWKTESAVQWSWKLGMEAGTLPAKAYEPSFKCGDDYPDLGDLPEYY